MMSKPFTSLLLALSMLACVSSANASEPALAQARMVMQSVMNAESGFINKSVHDEFWRLLKTDAENEPEALHQIVAALHQARVMASGYPLETWKSIQQSYEQRKVVRTPGFVKMSANLRGLQPQIAASVDNAERFLAAAANRTPISANGQTVYIDEERIGTVLNGIEASQSRLDRLFNPQWSEEMIEQAIPAARVTILTPDLFAISRDTIAGIAVPTVTAQRNLGPSSTEQIMFIQVPGADKTDLDRRALSACRGAFGVVGLTCKATAVQWRGLPGITAADSTSVDGIKIGLAVQVIKLESEQALQTFSVVAPGTATDASLALDAFMRRVKYD
ncbi:hypothetical protein [Pseudomonas wenzhouensis]|uniref:hypothetical protein n=1 Tax=Pseudomonas wenzhouensis TaxID=2906062 RepID=UPI001E370790|nr:hypothetical protein [Pseudomonas wenzhouensis]UFQ96761.1 hypothetical protein J7655_15865 [Pseudomonas wenzhouensis]